MDYDSFLELVKQRRTTRRFKPAPIPDEYIGKIIEAARWAPSGYNSQPWDFVVVREKKLKDTIVEWCHACMAPARRMEATRESWQRQAPRPELDEEMDYRNAPVFIILFGDTRTQAGLPMLLRYDSQHRQIIYLSSLANAFMYMHLAATTLGLASQWVSAIAEPFVHCMVKDLLGIPGELEVYDMMAVGYPANKPRPKVLRAREKMVHYDYCGEEDFRTEEEVNDFIKRTRAWVTANHRRGVDKSLLG